MARSEARFVPEDGLSAARYCFATPEAGVADGSAVAHTYQAAAAPKNAVVTLTGEVKTQAQRAMAEKARVSSSKREAGGQRVAGEEPEGHVVEVTVSSVHLLQPEPSQWLPAKEVAE